MTLPLLQSDGIGAGFVHGFSTRAGGVSAPPYDTLNLGSKWGDEPGHVTENRRRLAAAVGGQLHEGSCLEGSCLIVARQVHGTVIRRVRAGDDAAEVARHEADGLFTDVPGLVVGVFVADCVPVLLADPRSGACAAVHAGWRGTVAGILPEAVRKLASEFGSRPSDLRVALGPAIGPCCFEVGPEVAEAVVAAIPEARARGILLPSPRGRADKAHVDLHAANRLLLERAGVDPDAIDAVDLSAACTHHDRQRFFSFRRDGAATGQQMGVIGVDGARALEGARPRL